MKNSKICKQCNIEKDLSLFYKSIRKRNNTAEYSSLCKVCKNQTRRENRKNKSEKDKTYYQNNKEKILNKVKKYREENRDLINEKKREYYHANKTEINKKVSEKYANDIEFKQRKKEYEKSRYQKNKNSIKKQIKDYKKRNKTEINNKLNLKRKNDIGFKLRHNVSVSIRNNLKKLNSKKDNKSIIKYLSYSIQDLKEHLEKQFEPWMNWSNYGHYKSETWDDNNPETWVWNIDHIIPQSDLPYTSMEDENFKKCWALENLRPLSGKDNIIDGATRIRHL